MAKVACEQRGRKALFPRLVLNTGLLGSQSPILVCGFSHETQRRKKESSGMPIRVSLRYVVLKRPWSREDGRSRSTLDENQRP